MGRLHDPETVRLLRLGALGAFALALLLLLTTQFVPWTVQETEMDGAVFGNDFTLSSRTTAYMWTLETSGQVNGMGGTDRHAWFGSGPEGDWPAGIGTLRAGTILLTASLVLAAGALVLVATRYGNAAGGLGALAVGTATVGMVLFLTGFGRMLDGMETTWSAGPVLAILAAVALAAAAVLAVLPADEGTPMAEGAEAPSARAGQPQQN